jgi:FMN phosphatase YigB (HAD superfamily)
LFSNTNEIAVAFVQEKYPFLSRFNHCFYSHIHRCMKPDPAFYQILESTTGLKEAEILYVDDRLENVEAGRSRGWQCILHESPEKTLASPLIKKLEDLPTNNTNFHE